MKDFLGRDIEVGHLLVYPVRRGGSMWLRRLIVTDLTDDIVHGTTDGGRNVWLHRPDRSVIVSLLCEYCGHNPTSTEK